MNQSFCGCSIQTGRHLVVCLLFNLLQDHTSYFSTEFQKASWEIHKNGLNHLTKNSPGHIWLNLAFFFFPPLGRMFSTSITSESKDAETDVGSEERAQPGSDHWNPEDAVTGRGQDRWHVNGHLLQVFCKVKTYTQMEMLLRKKWSSRNLQRDRTI